MKHFILCLLAALSTIALAIPVPRKTYFLKTETVDGHRFDGRYITPLHTFAGTNAAWATEKKRYAVPVFLRDTALYFAFGKGADQQYPMQLQITDESAAWGTTTINILDKEQKAFAIKDGYLVIKGKYPPEKSYKIYDKGAHWRVCQWTHGVPELFWNNPTTTDNFHPKFNPATCSLVNLKVIPA